MAKAKSKKTMVGIKRNYSYRQYPDIYDKTLKNANACGTSVAKIIDDAFDAFNKNFEQMNGGKNG